MTLFGKKIEAPKFYVVEIANGKEFRVTMNYAFMADAEKAKSRMKYGKYEIRQTA